MNISQYAYDEKTMTNSNKTGLKTPKRTKIKHEQQEEV